MFYCSHTGSCSFRSIESCTIEIQRVHVSNVGGIHWLGIGTLLDSHDTIIHDIAIVPRPGNVQRGMFVYTIIIHCTKIVTDGRQLGTSPYFRILSSLAVVCRLFDRLPISLSCGNEIAPLFKVAAIYGGVLRACHHDGAQASLKIFVCLIITFSFFWYQHQFPKIPQFVISCCTLLSFTSTNEPDKQMSW